MHEAEGARLGLRYEYRLFDFDRLALPDGELPSLLTQLQSRRLRRRQCHASLQGARRRASRPPVAGRRGDRRGQHRRVRGRGCGRAQHRLLGLRRELSPRTARIRGSMRSCSSAPAAPAWLSRGHSSISASAASRSSTSIRRKPSRLADDAWHPAATTAAVAPTLRRRIRRADGLVNATPVGMAKYPGHAARSGARSERDLWVADIVYFPAETALLRAAAAAGCQTLPGAGHGHLPGGEGVRADHAARARRG